MTGLRVGVVGRQPDPAAGRSAASTRLRYAGDLLGRRGVRGPSHRTPLCRAGFRDHRMWSTPLPAAAGHATQTSPPATPTRGGRTSPYRQAGRLPPGCQPPASTSCGPTPDSISRCADPIAPAHRMIRSAVRSTAPSGPTTVNADRPAFDHPDAPYPGVGEQRQIGAVHRRLQVGPTRAHPSAAVDVQRDRTDTGPQRRFRSSTR